MTVDDVVERETNTIIRVAQDLIRDALRPEIALDAFLAEVVRQTQRLVPFDVGWLLLREGDSVRVRATDIAHRTDLGTTFPITDCISGLSMLRREPINIGDLADMPEALRRVYKLSRVPEPLMRSELVVPLMIGEDAIGSLNIESRLPAAFAPRQVELLRLLGGHAALAIELARSRQEAAALGEISLHLARETAMPDVVRTVLERALGLIGAHFGQLLLIEGADLVVHTTTNAPPREVGARIEIANCVCGLAVQEAAPVIVPDVTLADYRVVDFAAGRTPRLASRSSGVPRYQRVLERGRARIRAELAAPLWERGAIAGVLNVETPQPEGFTEAQRAELAEFGRAEGERFAAAVTSGATQTLQALLDEALAHAETVFGQLLQVDGDELVIVCTTGGEPTGSRVPIASSVSGQAVTAGAEVYVPDVDREPRYRRYLGEEMKSELAVPLVSRSPAADGGQALGVLNLESPVPAFFTAEHARILQALAGQAAVAIERAQRTEVERLAAIGGLAGDIIHRLNNPIGALSGWLDMLQRKPFYPRLAEEYPYVAQFVARAGRDISHAKSIIQELRAELRRQAPAPVDLQAAVAEALERCGLAAGQVANPPDGMRVAVMLPAAPPRVLAGPSLAGVFWNLFDNARKAMPEGGTLAISAGPAEASWVAVTVADTGVGIEPWRLGAIFEPGASTTADSYAPAHGLGLWWARTQVESFGGKIEVASEPGAGTRFTLRLRAAT